MCRNIKTLFNFDPPVTEHEVQAAALQFVRKISGFNFVLGNRRVKVEEGFDVPGVVIHNFRARQSKEKAQKPFICCASITSIQIILGGPW